MVFQILLLENNIHIYHLNLNNNMLGNAGSEAIIEACKRSLHCPI